MTEVHRWRGAALVAVVAAATLLGLPAAAGAGDGPAPGAPSAPRPGEEQIIGGTEAAPGTWRSQAAILDARAPSPAEGQVCGGTVIDPTWVLTAAHCVTTWAGPRVPVEPVPASALAVLVGTQDLTSGGSRIPVARVVLRGDFDAERLRNDYALLQLRRPAPVPLDLEVAGRTDVPWSGAPLRTAGWGQTDTEWGPTRLREVTVPALDPGECRAALYEAEVIAETPPYHSSHLCTGPVGLGGRGPCYGDSGGPLVWETGGRRILVGITSWGAYCGSPETPSVFAKVASAGDWIRRTIEFGPHRSGAQFALTTAFDYQAMALDAEEEELPPAPTSVAALIADLHSRPGVAHRDGTVVRLYQAVLGRRAEAWGYDYWRRRVSFGGVSTTRVAEVMARSAEFRAAYGSLGDAAFVAQLFRNVLGRPGAPADVTYWTGRLAGGDSRGRVAALVAESAENRARTQGEVDVQVAFLNLVDRAPAPYELEAWSDRPVGQVGRALVHSGAYARIVTSMWVDEEF